MSDSMQTSPVIVLHFVNQENKMSEENKEKLEEQKENINESRANNAETNEDDEDTDNIKGRMIFVVVAIIIIIGLKYII